MHLSDPLKFQSETMMALAPAKPQAIIVKSFYGPITHLGEVPCYGYMEGGEPIPTYKKFNAEKIFSHYAVIEEELNLYFDLGNKIKFVWYREGVHFVAKRSEVANRVAYGRLSWTSDMKVEGSVRAG